jgi:hypothetical protein
LSLPGVRLLALSLAFSQPSLQATNSRGLSDTLSLLTTIVANQSGVRLGPVVGQERSQVVRSRLQQLRLMLSRVRQLREDVLEIVVEHHVVAMSAAGDTE